MPGTTSKGYPYPLNTDPVTNGDDTIKALAEKVDSQLGASAAGGLTIATTGTNPSNGSVAVTFPAGRFGAIVPRVLCQQTSQIPAATGAYSTIYPSAISSAGFTANCRRSDAQTVLGAWFATSVDQ